jgi:hypothetical protein
MFQKRIHVFKAGDQTSAQGVARSFSTKDLDEVVKSYDPMIHEAPLVLGHQGDSDSLPSYGWIKGFERVGDNLYANVAFTDVAKDLVKDGHYRKCSISFYSPDSQINPHPGQWTARHLALLGAAPPAVKGLEPFNFAEWDSRVGVYDFAVKLDPMSVFDKDLGPTLIRDLSPLEMLKEKLDLARSEMSAAVADAVGTPEEQAEEDTSAEIAEAEENASEIENPSNPANFAERPRRGDNARSVADLEDQFPVEDFIYMEEAGISRKKKSTKHGQVSQVVENVYREDEDEMHTDHEERSANNPKMRNPRMEPGKVDYKEVGNPGYNGDDRYETAKSGEQQADRYKTGKTTPEKATFGRDKISTGKEQHDAGRPPAKNNGIEEDRRKTGRYVDPDDEGRYDEMSRDQMYNNNQYDDDVDYGVNDAESASGGNPAGRVDSETKVPTETEEMPDDEIFATKVKNVKGAKEARVMYIKGGEKMPKSHGGGIPGSVMADYGEPQPAEVTGKKGVYAEGRSKNAILSGEYEGGPDEMTLKTGGVYAESYRGEPKSTKKALTPGAFDSDEDDEPAEITGPSGVTGGADHKEMPAFLKKGKKDEMHDDHSEMEYGDMSKLPPALRKRAEQVKEQGHFAEEHKESTRERKAAADRGFEAKRQRKEGDYGKAHETEELEEMETKHAEGRGKKSMLSGQYEGGVGEETGPSGVGPGGDNPEFEEHEDEDNPYSRTGFGSTYAEDEDEDMDEEFCDMGQKKMTRAYKEKDSDKKDMEFSEFYAELQALKAENARIKQEYREAQIAHRREQIHSFVEGLYEQGKMVDSIIPERKLIEFAEGLEFGVLEFSEGETATGLLFNILNNLPNLVDFSEYAGGSMKFVEEADLDPHQKALAMVEKSGGELDYVEALKKAMYS